MYDSGEYGRPDFHQWDVKKYLLGRFVESFASDFQCLICLALEKFGRFTPSYRKNTLETVI